MLFQFWLPLVRNLLEVSLQWYSPICLFLMAFSRICCGTCQAWVFFGLMATGIIGAKGWDNHRPWSVFRKLPLLKFPKGLKERMPKVLFAPCYLQLLTLISAWYPVAILMQFWQQLYQASMSYWSSFPTTVHSLPWNIQECLVQLLLEI